MQICGAEHTRSNASSPSSEEWVTQICRIDNMSCLRGLKLQAHLIAENLEIVDI